jgi:hypothetical protein
MEIFGLIVIVLLLALLFKRQKPARTTAWYEKTRKCPHCRQIISARASACFHCGRDVEEREEGLKLSPSNPHEVELSAREYQWQDVEVRRDSPAWAIRIIIAIIILVGSYAASRAEPQTTFRDASGRTTGTAATDSQGTTTFRDASGRTTGTASFSNQGSAGGTTTFRDAGSRTTGTASTPWQQRK